MNEQTNLWQFLYSEKKITKPIRLIELFAGIGSQFKALKQLTNNIESWKICEWAYNSYCSYNAIHIKDFKDYSVGKTKEELINKIRGTSTNYNVPLTDKQLERKPIEWLKNAYNNVIATHNLINIMEVNGKDLEIVDTDKYEYILTYSFPCQDLSLAGKRQGMSVSQKDGGTRSGLLWEVERILSELEREREYSLPQILLMENVPEVIGKKNIEDFNKWQQRLEDLGYKNYLKVLNAKDYGIPQNRKRCFMISILGEYTYEFPKEFERKYALKDMLENNVDEKYYLSQKMKDYLTGINQKESKFDRGEVFQRSFEQANEKGIATTINTKAGRRPCDTYITIREATKQGYKLAEKGDGIDVGGRMAYHRGTVQKGVSQTIKTQCDVGVVVSEETK